MRNSCDSMDQCKLGKDIWMSLVSDTEYGINAIPIQAQKVEAKKRFKYMQRQSATILPYCHLGVGLGNYNYQIM